MDACGMPGVAGRPSCVTFANPSVTAAPCHRSTVRHSQSAPSHRAAFSGPVFRGCALRFAPCARHFSPSGLRCSQAHSRLSLPYWAYFALLRALRALRAPLSRLAPTAPLCERGAFWVVLQPREAALSKSLPTIIKCVTTQTFARGANRFGRRRSVATEPSKSRGARRLLWVSKSASDFDIIVSCGQRITQASMWLLSTSTRV